MPESNKTTRIAKNTTLLYIRMLIIMIINLYTVRVVLNTLGVEDYGIYNVIAGVVTMLNSVSSVLSTATQRYYSYSLGENKTECLRNIFSTSINIYAVFALTIIILGETLGLWFVNTQLVIPTERMLAANWIYQFSIFAFICTIIQVPYSAATIAHEDMGIFAIISTAECVLKLITVFLLLVIPYDRLIMYGVALLIISILVFISYQTIGSRKYEECHYYKVTEKSKYKEILSFSGWSLFGSIASVGMFQVNTILVNIFFGPLVNATRAIALQINTALSSFCNSFIMAIRPQMIKSYAENDYLYLNKIFILSNKLIYYSLLMACLPLIFEMGTILSWWLKTSDPQTVLFSRLIVVYALILSLNNPISIIIQATGHVKEYHIHVEFFTFLCVPATYILFKLGYPAYTTFITMIVAIIASHLVRLICLKKYYKPFSFLEYLKTFLLPAFVITLMAASFAFLIHISILNTTLRLCISILVSVLFVLILTSLIGLSKTEKKVLRIVITNLRLK